MPTPSFKKPLLNPLWLVRGLPSAALLGLILAQTLLRSNNWHDVTLGFSTGLLIAYVAASFSIKSVSMKDNTRPSDVENIRITS